MSMSKQCWCLCLLLLLLLCTCAPSPKAPLFELTDSEASGLNFANHVAEDDTFNILDFEFVYNGGGVAVARNGAIRGRRSAGAVG